MHIYIFSLKRSLKGNCYDVGLWEMLCSEQGSDLGRRKPLQSSSGSQRGLVPLLPPCHPGSLRLHRAYFLSFPSNVCLRKGFCRGEGKKRNPLRNQICGCLGSRDQGKEVRTFGCWKYSVSRLWGLVGKWVCCVYLERLIELYIKMGIVCKLYFNKVDLTMESHCFRLVFLKFLNIYALFH